MHRHPHEHARGLSQRPAGHSTPEEKDALAAGGEFYAKWDSGYSKQQSTRPQTLGYGLADSPVGQLAWIVEKFWAWTDCDGHPPENALTRDELLDNVMLYWVNNAAASSARLYWESFRFFGAQQSRGAHRNRAVPEGDHASAAQLVREQLQRHSLDGHAARRSLRCVRAA